MEQNKTFLLNRKINSLKNKTELSAQTISLMQWNTLNSKLCDSISFPKVDKSVLEWTSRKLLFIQEFSTFDSDFICLEEVNKEDLKFYEACLEGLDYELNYKEKPSQIDGLCLFYKKNKYQHIRGLTSSYFSRAGEMMTQVYQTHIFRIINTEQYIMVAMTHLKAKQPFECVRIEQISQLLTVILKEKEEFKGLLKSVEKFGILLCGDFNTEPDSESINLIQTTKIFKSAFEGESFTTFKLREKELCRVIDYIWYTDNLSLVEKLSMPTKLEIGEFGLPSKSYPSDHLSLYCKFEFI